MNESSIKHELDFWKGFVQTDRFKKNWASDTQNPELRPYVADFIRDNPHDSVLDAGSGVISILKGSIPDDCITPTDPLGDLYAGIYDYARKADTPLAVKAEDISSMWDNHFDIAHISNALDHTQRPDQALQALIQATRPGGFVIVQGFTNEALHENWQGFHQWNLDIIDGKLVCVAKGGRTKVLIDNPVYHSKEILDTGREWFVIIMQK